MEKTFLANVNLLSDEKSSSDDRVFLFDMDGVLATWQESPWETVLSDGYFLSRSPEPKMIHLARLLSAHEGCRVGILSAVIQDDHSETEKRLWLRRFCPFIPVENIFFVPYGSSKSECVPENLRGAVLIDDYTVNLRDWSGKAVKFYNGINGTKGTWTGPSIRLDMEIPDMITRLDEITAA